MPCVMVENSGPVLCIGPIIENDKQICFFNSNYFIYKNNLMKNIAKFNEIKLITQELQQVKGGARRRVRRVGAALRRRRGQG